MKKIFLTVITILSIGAFTAFASNGPEVDPQIVSKFKKEFSFAENVKWSSVGEFTQVSFSLNDQGFVAWYNADAELVSTARNIVYMQLPLSVIKSLEQDFSNAGISGILEITKDNETYYQMQADQKNKKYLLKATPAGNITVIKKIKTK